jgi:hypothetical protein
LLKTLQAPDLLKNKYSIEAHMEEVERSMKEQNYAITR